MVDNFAFIRWIRRRLAFVCVTGTGTDEETRGRDPVVIGLDPGITDPPWDEASLVTDGFVTGLVVGAVGLFTGLVFTDPTGIRLVVDVRGRIRASCFFSTFRSWIAWDDSMEVSLADMGSSLETATCVMTISSRTSILGSFDRSCGSVACGIKSVGCRVS